jgi:acyl-CoA thioester hydrolase
MSESMSGARVPVAIEDARDLAGEFSHRHSVEVRFADTDAMGHVNNAVYLTYVEAARVAWWCAATGEPIIRTPGQAESLILAEADIAFRAPVFHGDEITVESRATSIGRSSLRLEHRLTAARESEGARLVATCRSVIVRYDYEQERPVPFADEIVQRIERFEGRPLRA